MKGIEVARITVINDKLSVVLDSVIKPSSEIIDYNTRWELFVWWPQISCILISEYFILCIL